MYEKLVLKKRLAANGHIAAVWCQVGHRGCTMPLTRRGTTDNQSAEAEYKYRRLGSETGSELDMASITGSKLWGFRLDAECHAWHLP